MYAEFRQLVQSASMRSISCPTSSAAGQHNVSLEAMLQRAQAPQSSGLYSAATDGHGGPGGPGAHSVELNRHGSPGRPEVPSAELNRHGGPGGPGAHSVELNGHGGPGGSGAHSAKLNSKFLSQFLTCC